MSEKKTIEGDPEQDPNIPYGPSQLRWSDQVPEGANVTAPSENPIDVYPQVPPPDVEGDLPRIDYKLFEIPPTGLTDEQRTAALAALKEFAETQNARFTGYQLNVKEHYSSDLSWLLDMHTNNLGDPFQTGILTLNTKFCERAVLDYFAALWNAPWPHHDYDAEKKALYPERYWGYVLSMGSTEANIYGLFNARDYLKGRYLIVDEDLDPESEIGFVHTDPLPDYDNPNAYKPIVFYSEDVHYSVNKAVRMLELTTFQQEGETKFPGQCPITQNDGGAWPSDVPSHPDLDDAGMDNPLSGTIKVDDLAKLVRFFVERGYPILIVLNIGSTWKCAYDDVPAVNEMLTELGEEFPWLWKRKVHYNPDKPEHTDTRRGFWVHVDGALGAGYLPFIEMACNRGLIDEKKLEKPLPIFDFRNKVVMSICCSMHKWFGAPWPGSVYLTRTGYQLEPPDHPGYIGSLDTTLGGSRNAFSPVIFWDYLSRHSYEDSMYEALKAEDIAAYLEQKLIDLEKHLKKIFPTEADEIDLWVSRSEYALAVRFRQVNPTISYKYTVDSEQLLTPFWKDGEKREQKRSYSHVFTMQSVDMNLVNNLVNDIREAAEEGGWHNAFPEWIGDQPNPGEPQPISSTKPAKSHHIMRVPVTGRGLGSFVHPSKRR